MSKSRRETLSPPLQIRCPKCGRMTPTFVKVAADGARTRCLYGHINLALQWCEQREVSS